MCRFCPTCSNKADEEDKAPLPPGLTKTDERSPLHMVSGDGNAKATRFANAGKAQKDVKKAVCFFFGEADKTFAATVNAAAPVQQTAAVPQDRMCGGKGGSHLRCVKTDNIKSQMFSSLGMVLFMCSHGIPIVGSGINPEGCEQGFLVRIGLPNTSRIGDMNGDGVVSGQDLGMLLGQWGTAGSADLNRDGVVNGTDLGLMLGAWGR
jgi:hypothetical protein